MKPIAAFFSLFALLTSAGVQADPTLADKKNCMGCHHASERRVGPAFKAIATKYAGQSDAVDKLSQKIIKGGAGAWGAVPMPANAQVSAAEARQLTLWILSQK
jgi:cytochrome c